uniref:Uncharacterized protein n=1 Tax=Rhizophora mucronata TaxID=61149 RepID=A0A2P2Q072_RHIMU
MKVLVGWSFAKESDSELRNKKKKK